MPKPVAVSVALDTLSRKLVQLAKVAPDEVHAIEVIVDASLKRHHDNERVKRLAMFSRVK